MIKLGLVCLLLVSMTAFAQRQRRDPLTDLEIDKVRDSALDPDVRLKLYVEFARARLDKLEKARADAKGTDRDNQIKDSLQDFIDIYDELDDNVDTFADRDDDIRKPLKPVIEADTEFSKTNRTKQQKKKIKNNKREKKKKKKKKVCQVCKN